jgi:hypothetical protein
MTKDGKKIKKKKIGKKDGKVVKVTTSVQGVTQPLAVIAGVEEGKALKIDKKQKKEKKMKEKGAKKKKKAAAVVPVEEPISVNTAAENPVPVMQTIPGTITKTISPATAPKLGKKRKQAIALEGEPQAGKDAEKPKKKKKKKHQPEVVVQPWADLEGEDELTVDDSKAKDDKETKETDQSSRDDKTSTTVAGKLEKSQDEMFSDWSDDDSPVGEDSWLDEGDGISPAAQKTDEAAPATKSSPSLDDKGPSFDDVYDPISDDEFEAMYTQSDEEEDKKEKKDTSKALGIEDVDWSSLGIAQEPNNKGKDTIFIFGWVTCVVIRQRDLERSRFHANGFSQQGRSVHYANTHVRT